MLPEVGAPYMQKEVSKTFDINFDDDELNDDLNGGVDLMFAFFPHTLPLKVPVR